LASSLRRWAPSALGGARLAAAAEAEAAASLPADNVRVTISSATMLMITWPVRDLLVLSKLWPNCTATCWRCWIPLCSGWANVADETRAVVHRRLLSQCQSLLTCPEPLWARQLSPLGNVWPIAVAIVALNLQVSVRNVVKNVDTQRFHHGD
uniref:ABC2_membrane domain-containing protein n=1 Tax=Macrostomum lignano TaxID=282301 RepID=A0A1I8F6T2_9PLAT